jgi:hypothetical protein
MQIVKRLMYASSVAPALIILFITPVRAQAQTEAELIREAKKEARVVYWTTMRAPDAQALAQGFEAKYLFVKAEIVRISGDQLIERAITENRGQSHRRCSGRVFLQNSSEPGPVATLCDT